MVPGGEEDKADRLLYGGIFEQGQGQAISENFVLEEDRQAYPDVPRYMEKIEMNKQCSVGWVIQPSDRLPPPYTGSAHSLALRTAPRLTPR